MEKFGLINWLVVVLYFVGVLVIGAFLTKKNTSTKEYFLGGRRLPWWAIGLSVLATQASAITFIGAPGWGYNGGLTRMFFTLNFPIVMIFLVATLIPFFYNAGVVTVYEYLEKRFGSKSRLITSVLFLVSRGLATGVVIYAPALVLSKITYIDTNLAIAVMAVIAVLYTIAGGISAVIWTDVLQMFILWLGLIIAFITIVVDIPGGFGHIIQVASEAGKLQSFNWSFDLTEPYTIWGGLIGGGFLFAAYFGTDQSQVQRVLTSKSIKEAKMALVLGGFLGVIQMFIFLMIGVFLFVYYNGMHFDNPNDIFLTFVINKMPVGIAGLVIAAVFAAAMSSIDSALNSLATVTTKDIYQKYFKKNADDKHYLKASRYFTLLWGIYAAIFAFFASNLGTVIEAVNKVGSYFYGSLLGMFFLAVFTKRANGKGAVSGMIFGMLLVFMISAFTAVDWLWYNFFGAAGAFIVGYAVSVFTQDKKIKENSLYIRAQLQAAAEGKIKEKTDDGWFIIPGKIDRISYYLFAFFIICILLLLILQFV